MVQAFEIINEYGHAPVLLVCEHASNHVPDHLNNLGVTQEVLEYHIAWDPGALDVAKALSAKLDCPLFAAKLSRLVYDCNRPPEAKDAFPAMSEIYEIPGNANLSNDDIQWRIDHVYKPFQTGLSTVVAKQIERFGMPFIVTIHSFTPVYKGNKREVEIGILHDADRRLADKILEGAQAQTDLVIKRNEPYDATDGVTYTLREHGVKNYLQNVMIEIRNDLISDAAGVERIADTLYQFIDEALAQSNKDKNSEASEL